MKKLFALFVSVASILLVGFLPATVLAAGTSAYSLQTGGNSISIYETSSTEVNTVEADLSYTGLGAISSVGVTIGSTFTTCTSQTSTSIVCTALGGKITGTHLVAILTFAVMNPSADATVTASIADSSMILASSDSSDTLDHATLPSTSYRYTAPAPQPTPTSSPSKTTGSSNYQPAASRTTPAQPPATPASDGKTLADTNSKTTLTADKSAAKLPDTGWINVAAIIALLAALAAFVVALASWLKSHSIRISVTARASSSKHPAQKSARKSTKKSKP